MYRWIRNTHLVLGLSSALFVLLYAVSAAQMAHRWPLTRQVTDEDFSLALIALGASGIYLWFRIHIERTIGTVLLAANLAVSAVLLVALRL
jgi:hypothetical protein